MITKGTFNVEEHDDDDELLTIYFIHRELQQQAGTQSVILSTSV
jgi:hypothetical protein